MRVVIDGRPIADHFPGVGRYTYELVRALADAGPHDQFVVLHDRAARNTRFDVEDLALRPNVRLVGTPFRPLSLRAQLALGRRVRLLAPEVTHFPSFDVPLHPPRPVVVTVHDAIPLRPYGRLGAPRRLAFALMCRHALRVAAEVICPSQASRGEVCRLLGADPAKLHVVPSGVAGQFKPARPEEIDVVRADYGLPERYILHLGVNRPHKNLARLVEAFAGLAREFPETALVLAGPRDHRFGDAEAIVRASGVAERIHAIGSIGEGDLPALYSGAACFVFPSFGEGFGLPVLEAMACGTAVVCSADGSLPELADGSALCVPPDDVGALSRALAAVLRDDALRASLEAMGRARAGELSWRRTAALTLEVYRRAAGRLRADASPGAGSPRGDRERG